MRALKRSLQKGRPQGEHTSPKDLRRGSAGTREGGCGDPPRHLQCDMLESGVSHLAEMWPSFGRDLAENTGIRPRFGRDLASAFFSTDVGSQVIEHLTYIWPRCGRL